MDLSEMMSQLAALLQEAQSQQATFRQDGIQGQHALIGALYDVASALRELTAVVRQQGAGDVHHK